MLTFYRDDRVRAIGALETCGTVTERNCEDGLVVLDDTAGCVLLDAANAFETWLAASSPHPPSVIASDETMIKAFIPNVSLFGETVRFVAGVVLVTFSSHFLLLAPGLTSAARFGA